MSAFGKRGGISGGRPSFGVAKPMKGSGGGGSSAATTDEGGDQFPTSDGDWDVPLPFEGCLGYRAANAAEQRDERAAPHAEHGDFLPCCLASSPSGLTPGLPHLSLP